MFEEFSNQDLVERIATLRYNSKNSEGGTRDKIVYRHNLMVQELHARGYIPYDVASVLLIGE